MISPNSVLQVAVMPPVCSQAQFASFLGVTQDTVRGWVELNTVPHVKIGRQRYINIVEFTSSLKDGKTIFARGDFDES